MLYLFCSCGVVCMSEKICKFATAKAEGRNTGKAVYNRILNNGFCRTKGRRQYCGQWGRGVRGRVVGDSGRGRMAGTSAQRGAGVYNTGSRRKRLGDKNRTRDTNRNGKMQETVPNGLVDDKKVQKRQKDTGGVSPESAPDKERPIGQCAMRQNGIVEDWQRTKE